MNNNKSNSNPYIEALREFIRETIHNPGFFHLSPEKQKEIAKSYIDKHKTTLKEKNAENKRI